MTPKTIHNIINKNQTTGRGEAMRTKTILYHIG